MVRQPREWYPGVTYHITSRGNRKDNIFYEVEDYQKYLELVTECHEKYWFYIHAYCLMPNHIHLLLETTYTPSGDIMKFIHSKYAVYFNKKYQLTGHLFGGRYNSKDVLDLKYFLKVNKYIHQNPTKANIVKKPEDYRWSSYSAYLGKTEDPIVTMENTLALFHDKKEYIDFVMKEDEKIITS